MILFSHSHSLVRSLLPGYFCFLIGYCLCLLVLFYAHEVLPESLYVLRKIAYHLRYILGPLLDNFVLLFLLLSLNQIFLLLFLHFCSNLWLLYFQLLLFPHGLFHLYLLDQLYFPTLLFLLVGYWHIFYLLLL